MERQGRIRISMSYLVFWKAQKRSYLNLLIVNYKYV
jgi:hypothetical protein